MWWLLMCPAMADVDPADQWLGNDSLLIGLNSDASLINPDLELGIQWDPDGPEGEIPLGGDMIRVGHQWEQWSFSYTTADGSHSGTNLGPHDDTDLVMSWEGPWLSDTIHGLRASGDNEHMAVETGLAVSQTDSVLWIDTTITALVDMEDLWLARGFDPDQDYWATSSYGTDNTSGDGYASATGSYDGRAIALMGEGPLGLGIGGVCSWCTTPAGIVDAAGEETSGDNQPGVAVQVGSLLAGESAQVRFVYSFGLGEIPTIGMGFSWLADDDLDNDGSSSSLDCDDWDETRSPETAELADGKDNDCDGEIDEDTVASDDDGDGWTELDGDCDDSDPMVYPGAEPKEGVMNADCDGEADTGWWASGDTGSAEDTGAATDTASPEDTGLDEGSEDTASPQDTAGSAADTAIPDDKTTHEPDCGCSSQPSGGSGLAMLSIGLLGLVRRKEAR
jgi:MYXO-CTERM domain-containing protein